MGIFDKFRKGLKELGVSEVTSDKKGELNQILQLLKTKRNIGNQETKNHYFDLIQRIEKALNNTL